MAVPVHGPHRVLLVQERHLLRRPPAGRQALQGRRGGHLDALPVDAALEQIVHGRLVGELVQQRRQRVVGAVEQQQRRARQLVERHAQRGQPRRHQLLQRAAPAALLLRAEELRERRRHVQVEQPGLDREEVHIYLRGRGGG